jgi:TolB-like protein
MKFKKMSLFLFLFISLLRGQTLSRVQVAVINFDVSGIDASVSTTLTDRFRSELMNTGRYIVMERSRMDEILKEQGFQQTGACSNDACIVQAGRVLGVARMIAGSVGRVGKLYTVSARIVDIETGRILINRTEDCDCPIEKILTQSMRNLAFKMAGLTPGQSVVSPSLVPAKLSVMGKPNGALLTLNKKNIGAIPLIEYKVYPGTHTLKVKIAGYEDARYSIKLLPAEEKLLNIALLPKRKSTAIFRSMMFPGLGQQYAEKHSRAIFYPLLELSAIGGAFWANNKHNKAVDEYESAKEKYLLAIAQDEIDQERIVMNDKYNLVTTAKTQRTIFIGAAVGIWIWNIVDSIIWEPEIQTNKAIGDHSISPKMYLSSMVGTAQIGINLHF